MNVTEKYWFDHPADLFSHLSPIPEGDVTSPARVNALTRAVLYLSAILYYGKFPLWKHFLTFGLTMTFLLYKCGKTESKSSKEEFAFLNDNFLSNTSSKEMSTTPMNDKSLSSQAEARISRALNSIGTQNSYDGNISQWVNLAREKVNPKIVQDGKGFYRPRLLPGKRDNVADIQYFSVDQGVNRRTMIDPIIEPRILDKDVWGKSSSVYPNINNTTYVDMTNTVLDTSEVATLDPLSRTLAKSVKYVHQDPNAVWNSNAPGQDPDIGYYGATEYLYGDRTVNEFDNEILPLYKNKNNSWGKTFSPPNNNMEVDKIYPTLFKGTRATYKPVPAAPTPAQAPAQAPAQGKKEGFRYRRQDAAIPSKSTPVSDFIDTMGAPAIDNSLLEDRFYTRADSRKVDSAVYDKMNRVPPGVDVQERQGLPDQLYPQSPTYVYTDDYFKQPDAKLFLQDIQPKMYSYSVEQTPINANVGVTYMPQRPPRTVDQVIDADNKMSFPLYNRIDPQLIREQGTAGQLANNPSRSPYSARYSDWEPPAGTIDFEDIYDPRFNSYGDPYRSYSDVNLGQVQYYYSDIDAYRQPNFITRSNVDFIDYRDPMGKIKPYYNRTASVDDVRASVENQYEADTLFHRQDMMESLMAKRNAEMWQLREAPIIRQGSSQTTSSGGSSYVN
jgi:hypothetical protein